MKKLFSYLLVLISLLSFVSSVATVSFDIYKATMDGEQIVTSNSKVYGFDVVGYTCENAGCTLVGDEVSSLSKHTSSNRVSLSFPTKLLSEHGYLLYFYKDGYIGHEEYSVKINGTGSGVYPKRIYLYKKESGIAQIKNLAGVKNEIKNETRISLTYDVFADGD